MRYSVEKISSNMKKILEATVSLMSSSPYENITIKDICKEADVSRQTFYNYFKSKDEIFRVFFSDIAASKKIFSSSQTADYLFSEQYMLDLIQFFDEYSTIFLALYNQNILWYLGKDMVSSHKKLIFSNIRDRYILDKRNYYYLYITLPSAYICLEWIKNGKKETREELVNMMKYFQNFRIEK